MQNSGVYFKRNYSTHPTEAITKSIDKETCIVYVFNDKSMQRKYHQFEGFHL